jgi:hypothetical protein
MFKKGPPDPGGLIVKGFKIKISFPREFPLGAKRFPGALGGSKRLHRKPASNVARYLMNPWGGPKKSSPT